MNGLARIDTTQVYHEFDFSGEQVKGLTRKQWFIHVDLMNWLEEELNRRTDWNVIKILYKQIYHFDLNHVKCLEIYFMNSYDDPTEKLFINAQYKMPWKGETIYYTKIDTKRFQNVDERLRKNNLQNYLTKSYEMKVDWKFERSLTVYEFDENVNHDQKLKLDKIFQEINSIVHPIFISRDFLFLNVTEPPTIMETEALLPFHGQFLAELNIQDILAVELANKDYRLPFYDRDLDHDIQMHLQTRFPMLYGPKKLKTYVANEFTSLSLLKYFIYKYRHCLSEVVIPHQMSYDYEVNLFKYVNRNLKFNILENINLHVDVMSPGNISLCSLTYIASRNALTEHSPQFVRLSTKYIHLDHDMNINLNDFRIIEIDLRSLSDCYNYSYFEILIRTYDPPATLSVLIHKLLEQIEMDSFNERITVRLTAFNNRINNSILNMFLKTPSCCKLEFKNITFHVQSLMKWLGKAKIIMSVSFIGCQIVLNRSRTKVHQITRIGVHLPIRCRTIVFDNCQVNPSVWLALSSTTFDIVCFKNMPVELYTIASLQYGRLNIKNCQILGPNKIVESSPINPDDYFKITLENMRIEMRMLCQILYKFDDVTFVGCRILCTDNFIPKMFIKLKNLRLTEMPITPELKNNLKYFEVTKPIEFQVCQITNEHLLQIWRSKRNQKLTIKGTHQINGYIYLELIAILYENRLDQLHLQFKDGTYIPFEDLVEIEWQDTSFRHVDWREIQIRSVPVNDATIKLEYIQNGELFDIFYLLNKLPNDSAICDVDYF